MKFLFKALLFFAITAIGLFLLYTFTIASRNVYYYTNTNYEDGIYNFDTSIFSFECKLYEGANDTDILGLHWSSTNGIELDSLKFTPIIPGSNFIPEEIVRSLRSHFDSISNDPNYISYYFPGKYPSKIKLQIDFKERDSTTRMVKKQIIIDNLRLRHYHYFNYAFH